MKFKVFIVDDSTVFRTQLRGILHENPKIEVVGTANNGENALALLKGREVDLIILDLEMPIKDGLETLKELKNRDNAAQVIMFSSVTVAGAAQTVKALSYGALDFATKPSGEVSSLEEAKNVIRNSLMPKVTALVGKKFDTSKIKKHKETNKKPGFPIPIQVQTAFPQILVIGSSTGGPRALEDFFRGKSWNLKIPICIVQHMPPLFTKSLAQNISEFSNVEAIEVTKTTPMEAGKIYIAPGGKHMDIINEGGVPQLRVYVGEPVNHVKPAIDPLFSSAANLYKNRTLGIIFTGMGQDGLNGCRAIKEKGGNIFIQSEESCVVFGMPGAVFRNGCFDAIGTPAELSDGVHKQCSIAPTRRVV